MTVKAKMDQHARTERVSTISAIVMTALADATAEFQVIQSTFVVQQINRQLNSFDFLSVADENECKYRPCDVFAHCTNTLGSFTCTCFPGYVGDGLHCEGETVECFLTLNDLLIVLQSSLRRH